MRGRFSLFQSGVTAAATAVTISFPRVRQGEYWLVTHVSAMNASGESVKAALGIVSLGQFTQIYAQQTVANGDAWGSQVLLLVTDGQQLGFQVTGAADEGPVTLYLAGARADTLGELELLVANAAEGAAIAPGA